MMDREEEEMKECTFKPKINSKRPQSRMQILNSDIVDESP